MSDNSEATSETVVDVNTDSLEDFEAMYYETEKVEEVAEEVEEEVTPVEETDAKEDEEVAEADAEDEVEEEEEAEEPAPEPEPRKNRKSAKERISELTADKRLEREARLAAEARTADLEARLAKLEKLETEVKETVSETDGLVLPNPDEVDAKGELVYPLGPFDPKYNAEVIRRTMKYESEQAAAEAEAQAAEKASQEAVTTLQTEWSGKLEAVEKDIPDLRDRIAELEDSFIDLEPTHGQFIAETIMTLSRGPEVLYYLADNLSEAEAIVAMGPRAATLALGEIHGRLPVKTKAENSNKQRVSTAPRPPVVTRGNGASVTRVAPDTDNLEDFEREYYKKR